MSNNCGIKQGSVELDKLWKIIQKNPEIGMPRAFEKATVRYKEYMNRINAYQKKRLEINPDLKKYDFVNPIKIQQLLNKKPYKGSFYYDVLTGIAIAGGFTDWDDYMKQEWPNKYNSLLSDPEDDASLYFDISAYEDVSKIKEDSEIILGWYPKRYVKLRYLGDFKFKVLEKNRIVYTKDMFLRAQEFSIDLTRDFDKGHPIHPNIFAIYKGDMFVINFDKRIRP